MEQGANPYANPSARKALEHRDAAEQSYYRIDDAVFICEQQFMATLIQVPLAVDPTLFASLTLSSFMTPVFRTLFQAVVDAQSHQSGWSDVGIRHQRACRHAIAASSERY